ncbi:MAG: amidohydrolase [Deltaproteobacteria bacterium]|nr:amidohydrolase [Deltaproteobacteria bacterium]MBW2393726.1 amidohydrolase [Deltaproteobacteria bacterium]
MTDLGYPVYDADNHLYETEEAMTANLPKKWRKEFQYVDVNGRRKLAVGGVISDYIPNPTFDVVAAPGSHELWYRAKNTEGLSFRELSGTPIRSPAAFRNGEDRLKLMDEQGIHAALMFPTLASVVEERMNYDHELMNAVIHSLNLWMEEQWGFHAQERLFTVPFVTLMDVDMAVAELEWALERGARTVGVRPAPVPGYRGSRSFGFEEFDPFWARVQEAGIFVSMHASDSGYDRFSRMWQGGSEFLPFRPDPFKMCMGSAHRAISDSMAAFVCHGVFERFPGVRVASIENGSKWVKGLIDTFHHVYGQMPKEFKQHPVEQFREHVYVAPFYEEPIDELAELIGIDHILFGSDYPHPEGLANPVDFVAELKTLSATDQRKVMSDNLKTLLTE